LEADLPNIIFIMTDDHTKQAMSAYSDKLIQTPNIDRIAKEGIRFDQSFVTNSICGPSRAVILTGKYSHINGFKENLDEFDTSQMTFPKLLQTAGYQTFLVGKWHLKNQPTGFDYWNILPGQGYYYNPKFIEMGDTVVYDGYVTDITTDIALETLENRNKNKPFCLLLHHKAPHRNWMPDIKHLNLLKENTIPLPATFYDNYATRSVSVKKQDMRVADMFLSMDMKLQPDYYEKETGTGGHHTHDAPKDWSQLYGQMNAEQKAAWDEHYQEINEDFQKKDLKGKALAEWKYQRYMKDYLRCVVSVDENIGRVLHFLDEYHLAENTIIVYTSDQGFYLGEHGWFDKRFMYEESFSMPLAIRYPKEIVAGQTTDAFALNLDFAATFLDYANVPIPQSIQGRSLRPICNGKLPNDWRKSVYYHYYQARGWHHVPRHYGIRTDAYKLIHYYEQNDWELYDLKKDTQELNNVVSHPHYSKIRETLIEELQQLQEDYKVPITPGRYNSKNH
jgi:arylsulfatase A-like enzyme